jgi:hypothetical protein
MVSNNPIMSGNGNGDGRASETAAAAYAKHLRNVAAVLDWVQAELEEHQAKHRASPGNWGLVGDLAEAERLAKRLLGHVAGIDGHHVDEALAGLDA